MLLHGSCRRALCQSDVVGEEGVTVGWLAYLSLLGASGETKVKKHVS